MSSINVKRATRKTVSYTITDENDEPVDLSQATNVYLRVADRLGAETYKLEETADVKNSDGVASWTLDNEQTDMTPGLYFFEIEIVYSAESSTMPVVDRFFVEKRVKQ